MIRTKGTSTKADTFSWLVPPKHVGFGVAVVLMMVGAGFTTTTVFEGALEQPAAVAVKV